MSEIKQAVNAYLEKKEIEPKKVELVKEPELIAPASVEKTIEALKRFEEFKRRVLTEDDYVPIQNRKYIKKSGWLKYALACNISLEKREEREEVKEDGTRVYHYTYRAIAPSGRFADAVGSASSDERDFAHEIHDVRALAQTRAMERAISNLVGGGELGAEELLPVKEAEVEVREAKPKPTQKEAQKEAKPAEQKEVVQVEEVKTKEPPPGAVSLTEHDKLYGWMRRTDSGAEVYFDPPLDLTNDKVRAVVENFLCTRVLDGIKNAVQRENAANNTDFLFNYERIESGGKLLGISITADKEALTDERLREIRSSAKWTAARAAEKTS